MAGIILGLMGGLGMFLYGMKLMSDALEKAAGAKMRSILEFFTKTPLRGILVGTFFTAVIQSSSASTVMVVSFVNSGLMNLYQAAGVIMGANIGTTVTSQLISLNLSALAPAIVMVGVVMVMFCKKTKIQRAGEVLLGFGILFMGLSGMSDSMSVLRESPQVVEIMSSLTSHFLAVMVGLVVTTVLQSSSATVGIVLLLAQQGLLDIRICYFIIFGCNIGSCVSALLAAINGKKIAKTCSTDSSFLQHYRYRNHVCGIQLCAGTDHRLYQHDLSRQYCKRGGKCPYSDQAGGSTSSVSVYQTDRQTYRILCTG